MLTSSAPPSQAICTWWRAITRTVRKRNVWPGSTDARLSSAIETASSPSRRAESCGDFGTVGSQPNAAVGRFSAALSCFAGAIASAAAMPEARSARAGESLASGDRRRRGRGGRVAVPPAHGSGRADPSRIDRDRHRLW